MKVFVRSAKLILTAVVILAMAFVCIFPIVADGLLSLFDYWMRANPELLTQPLQQTKADKICVILNLAPSDPRCSAPSYGFEFFPDLRGEYGRFVFYEAVDATLGEYLMGCGEWVVTESDGTFRSCYYDLAGDGAFPVEIVFRQRYKEPTTDLGETWQVCTPGIRDEISQSVLCEH